MDFISETLSRSESLVRNPRHYSCQQCSDQDSVMMRIPLRDPRVRMTSSLLQS